MRVCQQLLCIFHIRGLEELVDEVLDLRNVLESVPNYKNIYKSAICRSYAIFTLHLVRDV